MPSCCGSNGTPFVQTQFLGASIANFESSVDWGGSGGSLRVTVIEDTCAGSPRVSYDPLGNASTSTSGDTFLPPGVGEPVFFQYGGFYMGGILNDWNQYDSAEGEKAYNVVVDSPGKLLEGIQVILNSYDGATFGVPNLLNAHGFTQSLCGTCLETGFYTAYPPYGMASALTYMPAPGWCKMSEAGWRWPTIRDSLMVMLAGGGGAYGGLPHFRGHYYYIDISEVPIIDNNIRLNAENMSLADIISHVCGIAGMDYFYELYPATGSGCGGGSGPHMIKVKVGNAPWQAYEQTAADIDAAVCTAADTRLNMGVIGSAIASASCVNKYQRGVQLKLDTTTAFMTGEFRKDLWQIDYMGNCDGYSDTIWPYWGKHANGNVIIGDGCAMNDFDPNGHTFTVDTSHLNIGINTWKISMPELRCALVSEDSWRHWLSHKEPTKWNQLDTTPGRIHPLIAGGYLEDVMRQAIADNAAGNPNSILISAIDFAPAGSTAPWVGAARGMQDMMNDAETWQHASILYEYVRKYATEYFGKKFLVKLPLCKTLDPDSPWAWATNWVGSEDGGWSEWSVLGLAQNNWIVQQFREPDGKISGFVRYISNDPMMFDNLSKDDFFPVSSFEVYVRAEIEEIVWVTPTDGRAVVSVSGPIKQKYRDDMMPEWLLLFALTDGAVPAAFFELFNTPANDKTLMGMEYAMLLPVSACLPLKSQRLVYGPWFVSSSSGWDFFGLGSIFGGNDKGLTHYERDSSYAPWNFGSFGIMNYAGSAYVASRLGDKYVSEQGEITFPGAPAGNLGSLIASGGPIIDHIDVVIPRGRGQVMTNYRMKTYIPDYGKLGKARVDSIRNAAQIGIKANNIWRTNALKRVKDMVMSRVSQEMQSWQAAQRFAGTSSHDILAGAGGPGLDNSHNVSSSLSRQVMGITKTELNQGELEGRDDAQWKRRAAMQSLGMFRPFSTYPTSVGIDTPHIAHFEEHAHPGGCPKTWMWRDHIEHMSTDQVPPLFCQEHHLPIGVDTLSPFLKDDGNSARNRICLSPTSTLGHDIEYIVRDGTYPTDIRVRQGPYSQDHWYRGIALRGPLIVAGWGFDIENKPVPNMSDTYPDNPKLEFVQDWLHKPHLWKCGPVDLRWDYRRKVWTSPTPHKIVKCVLDGNLCPNDCAPAIMYDEDNPGDPYFIQSWDYDGIEVPKTGSCAGQTGWKVTVYSNAMRPVPKGWRIMAMFDTTKQRYQLVNHDEFPILEATVVDKLDCSGVGNKEAIITGVAGGGSLDPCDAFTGKKVYLENPLKQPICPGSKVFVWVNDVVCDDYQTKSYPIIGECNQTCNDTTYYKGVVLQAEFHPVCFVTHVELLELYCWGEDKFYDEETTTIKTSGMIETYADGIVCGEVYGELTYANVEIHADQIHLSEIQLELEDAYAVIPQLELYIEPREATIEGQYLTWESQQVYIQPTQATIPEQYATIPEQYLTIEEQTLTIPYQTIDIGPHVAQGTATGVVTGETDPESEHTHTGYIDDYTGDNTFIDGYVTITGEILPNTHTHTIFEVGLTTKDTHNHWHDLYGTTDEDTHWHTGYIECETEYGGNHDHAGTFAGWSRYDGEHTHTGTLTGETSYEDDHFHTGIIWGNTDEDTHTHTGTIEGYTSEDGEHTHEGTVDGVITGGSHYHDVDFLGTVSDDNHMHQIVSGTGIVWDSGSHDHDGTFEGYLTGDGNHDHAGTIEGTAEYGGEHVHTGYVSGTTSDDGEHFHTGIAMGTVDADGEHDHTATPNLQADYGGEHDHTANLTGSVVQPDGVHTHVGHFTGTSEAGTTHTHDVVINDVVTTDGWHNHTGFFAGTTTSDGYHDHTGTTDGYTSSDGDHDHSLQLDNFEVGDGGAHTHGGEIDGYAEDGAHDHPVTGSTTSYAHSHALDDTLQASLDGDHTHPHTLTVDSGGGHEHTANPSGWSSSSAGGHDHTGNPSGFSVDDGGSHAHGSFPLADGEATGGGHTHPVTGNTNNPSHSHPLTGSLPTDSKGNHTHTVGPGSFQVTIGGSTASGTANLTCVPVSLTGSIGTLSGSCSGTCSASGSGSCSCSGDYYCDCSCSCSVSATGSCSGTATVSGGQGSLGVSGGGCTASGHTHGQQGTFGVTGSTTAALAGAHTHNVTLSGSTGSVAHSHTLTGAQANSTTHTHPVTGSVDVTYGGSHGHGLTHGTVDITYGGAHTHPINEGTVDVVYGGDHSHGLSGSISNEGDHQHDVPLTGDTSSVSHSHELTGAQATGGTHTHDVEGTLTTDEAYDHTHPLIEGDGVIGYGGEHEHTFDGDLYISEDGTHNHTVSDVITVLSDGNHDHTLVATKTTTDGTPHTHIVDGPVIVLNSSPHDHVFTPGTVTVDEGGEHNHTVSGDVTVAYDGEHTHPAYLNVVTDLDGYHTHTFEDTFTTNEDGEHEHDVHGTLDITLTSPHTHESHGEITITYDGEHRHELTITEGETDYDLHNHIFRIEDQTESSTHIHTFDEDLDIEYGGEHTHTVEGTVYLEDATHYHELTGNHLTTATTPHNHTITGTPILEESGEHVHEVYGTIDILYTQVHNHEIVCDDLYTSAETHDHEVRVTGWDTEDEHQHTLVTFGETLPDSHDHPWWHYIYVFLDYHQHPFDANFETDPGSEHKHTLTAPVTISDMYLNIPATTAHISEQTATVYGQTLHLPEQEIQFSEQDIYIEGQYLTIEGDQLYVAEQQIQIPGQTAYTQEATINIEQGYLTIPEQYIPMSEIYGTVNHGELDLDHNLTVDVDTSAVWIPDSCDMEFYVKYNYRWEFYKYDLCVCIQQLWTEAEPGKEVCGTQSCGFPDCPTDCDPDCICYDCPGECPYTCKEYGEQPGWGSGLKDIIEVTNTCYGTVRSPSVPYVSC